MEKVLSLVPTDKKDDIFLASFNMRGEIIDDAYERLADIHIKYSTLLHLYETREAIIIDNTLEIERLHKALVEAKRELKDQEEMLNELYISFGELSKEVEKQ